MAESMVSFLCSNCGAPASCLGSYEGDDWGYACNACCKHGCEDGHCEPVSAEAILDALNGMRGRVEAAEREVDQARAEGAETARKHRYTCDVCGKRAMYEQCGGRLTCEEHVYREEGWWLIDESTAKNTPWDQVEITHMIDDAVAKEREACAAVARETADRWSKAEQFVEAARSDARIAPAFDSHANSAHCVGARQASSEIAEAIRARGKDGAK